LPGDVAIEKMLRSMVETDIDGMKMSLGKPDLKEILFGLLGLDHHEWYEGFCRNLGQHRRQLLPALIRIWMRQAENDASARQAVEGLAKLYKNE
jgi:hypothetical protein